MNDTVRDPRAERRTRRLLESDVHRDPLKQFGMWYEELVASQPLEPGAAALATTNKEGRPSVRMVLLRGFDASGFVFYTNYESQKGRELAENPRGALLFYWPELDRQVRVEGAVEQTSEAESDAYFVGRPTGHRVSAWASPQSRVIADRADLERRVSQTAKRFEGLEISRPPHWGGYRVVPDTMEFWQGGPERLHDRLRYRRRADGTWLLERLAP